jgi:branched-chain amino acid transport system permease protein
VEQKRGMRALAQRLRKERPLGWVGIIAALIVAVVIPQVVHSDYVINIGVLILLYGYLATAWGLVGQSGQLSFGHVAFLGLGAYTSTILYKQFGVTPWLGMFAGAGIATAAGAGIGFPTLRLRGVYFALATLAFAYILQIFIQSTMWLGPIWIGGAPGLHITLVNGGNAPHVFQFASKVPYYYIALGMLVGIVYISYYLNRTRIGYYWAAVRGDPDAAESLGISVARYRIMAFLISCFLTGLAGTFYAQYFRTLDPRRILGLGFSIEIALMGIVGGWQSVFGPMIGALMLTPIGQVMRAQLGGTLSGLHLLIYGIILMLFIHFLPRGLNSPIMRGLRWAEAKVWRSKEYSYDRGGR